MKIAFTGHRPDKLGGYAKNSPMSLLVKAKLAEAVGTLAGGKLTDVECFTGMAIGVDQWAAQVCVALGIKFKAILPFEGQSATWPQDAQREYVRLLQLAEEIITLSPPPYTAKKMQIRNEWMVDRCDHLIAVWDGSTGGTSNCVAYAKRVETPLVILDPRTWI